MMLRNVQKARSASLSYKQILQLQKHWNNWFLLQEAATKVITGGRSAGLWAMSCLEGDNESKEQRNSWMALLMNSEPRGFVLPYHYPLMLQSPANNHRWTLKQLWLASASGREGCFTGEQTATPLKRSFKHKGVVFSLSQLLSEFTQCVYKEEQNKRPVILSQFKD